MVSKVKRLGILSIYDAEGIVDNYLLYYANSLLEVLDEFIIVINGKIKNDCLQCLQKLSDKIIIRENKGFDIGAYKAAVEKIGSGYLQQYDEVVLSNDTNFGPFIPFLEIFETLGDKHESADFWGINYEDRGIFGFLDAYFLVFRKNALDALTKFLSEIKPDEMEKTDVVHSFEIGLFQRMIKKQYNYASYTMCHNIDLYKAANYAVRKYNIPLMKKRCFEEERYIKDNCLDCLKYIKENFDYDINLVLDSVKRKYGITYDLENEFKRDLKTQEIFFDETKLKQKDVEELLKHHKKVYIYGIRYYAKILFDFFSEYVEGFIVSDEYYDEESYLGKKVYKYSDVNIEKEVIIVAVKRADAIKTKLGKRDNVLYLW